MVKNTFSGVKVTFYQMPDGSVYAVAVEYEHGQAIDAERYDVLAMSEAEVEELANVGGVYTDAPTPKVRSKWIEENGNEIALSIIQGGEYDGGVELQWCKTDIPCIKKAFGKK